MLTAWGSEKVVRWRAGMQENKLSKMVTVTQPSYTCFKLFNLCSQPQLLNHFLLLLCELSSDVDILLVLMHTQYSRCDLELQRYFFVEPFQKLYCCQDGQFQNFDDLFHYSLTFGSRTRFLLGTAQNVVCSQKNKTSVFMGVKIAIYWDIAYVYNKNVLISLCCDPKFLYQSG